MSCENCNGTGWIYDSGGREHTCQCLRVQRVRLCLDRHGLKGVRPKLGPLTELAGHALVRCRWREFLPHLAGWLVRANLLDPSVRITTITDADVRNLWLGQRRNDDRSSGGLLHDLTDFDLVVVRVQSIKHGGTSNALMEAISNTKATWLIEPPFRPLEKGHPVWTEDLEATLDDEGFTRVDLSHEGDDIVSTMMGGSQ